MRQFREEKLLEQLVRKPEVSDALAEDKNGGCKDETKSNGEFNK